MALQSSVAGKHARRVGAYGVQRSIAFACLLFFPALVFAESAQSPPKPTTLPVDARFVVSCAVDNGGAFWIGTEDQGVWRIGAGNPTHYTTSDGLGDDDAYAIAIDLKGRTWVGHSSHGVSVFDGAGHWRNYDVTSGPWGSRVFAITVCPIDGDVWIATEAGLTRYASQTDSWTNVDRTSGLPANEANALAFNAEGDLFVGLQCGGVAVARRGDNYRVWQTTSGPDEMPATASGEGLPTPLVNAILVAHDGTIYAGTTRGLAYSRDDGKSWNYLRGSDWPQLAKGRYEGPPPGLKPSPSVLQEDWITCLAEGPGGVLWVGHRDRGYEALQMADLSLIKAEAKGRVRAIAADEHGGIVVGLYGDGALASSPPDATSAPTTLPAPIALPSIAAAPGEAALEKMRADVLAWGNATAVVENLTDDWQTKGDWPGRYGRRYTELTGPSFGNSAVAAGGYAAAFTTGPYRPSANIYTFRTGQGKTNGNYPYCPDYGCRDAAEFNDGSWQLDRFPQWQQGPDIFVAVTLPSGCHRVSIFLLNHDAHAGNNGDRDYDVQVKLPDAVAALEPGSALVDDGPTNQRGALFSGRGAIDAELAPLIARSRVPQFAQPVYKRFLIRGAGRYWIKIGRNHSCCTKLQGLFVDDEGAPVEAQTETVQVTELPPIELPKRVADAAQQPGPIGVAARLWDELDGAVGKDGYAAACWPMRLAAYRAAVAAGADESLLAGWRWRLGIWTPGERLEMDELINNVSSKHSN